MIGFIGCGNMGKAMLEGILSSGLLTPREINIFDEDTSKTEALKEEYGVNVAVDLSNLCRESKKIFLSVKPQDMRDLLLTLRSYLNFNHLLISVAAGLNLDFYEVHLNQKQKVIRLMPNAPCLVGEGMIAVCSNERVSRDEEKNVIRLLEPLGQVIVLEEKHFDAVTAISGSGPAYIFLVIEALADGGVEMGLGRDVALQLAAQTVLGSAKMCLATSENPALLKSNITSPGGTTSAGLVVLEEGSIRSAFIKAVKAATQRSKKLGSKG